MIKSHERETWRLFDKESWRMNKLSTIIYLFIFMSWWIESRIQVNTRFQHFNSTWILSSNIMTQLEYSISKFWLELSLDELRTWLNLDNSTWRDQFIYMLVIMSNLFNFLVKCVNSYFSDANVTSWVQAHFMQTSCALLSVLQISSVNLS